MGHGLSADVRGWNKIVIVIIGSIRKSGTFYFIFLTITRWAVREERYFNAGHKNTSLAYYNHRRDMSIHVICQ